MNARAVSDGSAAAFAGHRCAAWLAKSLAAPVCARSARNGDPPPPEPRRSHEPTILPQPGIMDIALYEAGRAMSRAGHRRAEAVVEREPVRPQPEGARGVSARRAPDAPLPVDRPRGPARRRSARCTALDPDRIICGVGSDEIMHLPVPGLCRAGRRGDHHRARLLDVPHHRPAAGATPVRCPRRERVTDVDAILSRLRRAATRLVFIANPNNPTGTMIGGQRAGAAGRRGCPTGAAGARRRLCGVRRRLRRRRGAGRGAAPTC